MPAADWTWDDFESYLKKAQPNLPQGVKAANLGGGLPNYFIEYVQAQGQELFNGSKVAFPQQTLVDFWTKWESWRKAGLTTTAQEKAAEAPQTEQSFIAQGKVLADNKPGNQLGQAQGALTGAKAGQQLTTVALPGGSGGPGSVLFTSGFSIPKSCNNQATAAAYINFWVNDHDANMLFSSNNGADTNQKELQAQIDNPKLDAATKHMLSLFKEIVAKNPPTVLYPPGYQANFETAFTRAYQQISLNGADVQSTAKSFIDNLNSALAARPVTATTTAPMGAGPGRAARPHPQAGSPKGDETVTAMDGPIDGQDGRPASALTEMTVLDLTQVMAGPFCTMILADLGADVIKVENPEAGDQTRRLLGRSENGEDSRAFLALNRNKRSITLDLKSAEGLAQFHRLVRSADVVVENWRPGVAARLGVDYDTLSALNPALVYASISGFGQTGPYADRPGYDLIAQAMSGRHEHHRGAGRPPGARAASRSPTSARGCSAPSASSRRGSPADGRARDSRWRRRCSSRALALAVWESTEFWDTGRVPQKLGSANRMSAPYQALATKDGFVTVGANNDRLWRRLCTALDLEHLVQDPRFRTNVDRMAHRPELAAVLEERLAQRTTAEWVDLLARPRACPRAHPGLPPGPRGGPARQGAGHDRALHPPGRGGRAGARRRPCGSTGDDPPSGERRRCSASTTTRSSTAAEPSAGERDPVPLEEGDVEVRRCRAACTSSSANPRRRNALTWRMYDRLLDGATRWPRTRLRVVVLRRRGDAFAAGTDIRQFVDFRGGAARRRVRAPDRTRPRRACWTCASRWWVWSPGPPWRRPGPRRGVRHPRRDPRGELRGADRADPGELRPRRRRRAPATPARGQPHDGDAADRTTRLRVGGRSSRLRLGRPARPELEDGVRRPRPPDRRRSPADARGAQGDRPRLAAANIPDEDLLEHCYGSADFREGVSAFVDAPRTPVGRALTGHREADRRTPALLDGWGGRPVRVRARRSRHHRPGLRSGGPRRRSWSIAASTGPC